MEKRSKAAAVGRGVVATLTVAVVAASVLVLAPSIVLGPGSGPASAEVLASSVVVLADGTGHGTSASCGLVDGSIVVDATATDGVVCTNDAVMFGWAFNLDAGGADAATFEQTLPEHWSWDPIAVTACEGNGVDYSGSGTISPDGRTLTCVLDQPPSANTASLQVPVVARVGASAPNLSTYAATLTVTESGGTPQVSTAPPVTVRAAPRFELVKLPAGGQGSLGDRDFGSGPEPAYYADFYASIVVPMAANPKGIEPLASQFSFVDDLEQVSPKALVELVYGSTSGSPTWSQPGGPGTPATITVTGATTATFLPPTFIGTNVVWYSRVRIALPASEVPAYPVGKDIVNRYRDFLPVGVNGTANLGGSPELGSESGANCDYLADPSFPNIPNDNCALFHLTGPSIVPGTPAVGTKSIYQREPAGVPCATAGRAIGASRPRCPRLPGDTGSENGYALEGDAIWAEVYLGLPRDATGATIPLTNLAGCDRWDAARQQIDPSVAIKFGFPNDLPTSEYTVEYTDQVLADDTARQAAGCGTPGNASEDGPWYPSITAAGGPAEVSGVRVTYTGASTFGGGSGQGAFAFAVPLLVGDVPGAVADFFSTRWDEQVTPQNPSGSTVTARAGFRSTAQVLSLDKDTDTVGQTGTVVGATVDFTLTPAVAAPGSPSPAATTGLVVTDLLDPCMLAPTLSAASTDWTMAVSTPADLGPDGLACTGDGEVGATLTFEHGSSVTPNQPVQPISYSVLVSQFTSNGASIENTAVVDADGNGQTVAQRSDTVSLFVVAPGAATFSKVADVAEVGIAPDQLSWTVAFSNTVLSPASAGRTEFIDVLPYVGDGRGSSFEGDYDVASIDLVGAPSDASLAYTSSPPDSVDPDPDANTTAWCSAADFGSAGCPDDLASVTAFKVVVDDFARNERGGVKVALTPSGNRDGDVYANAVGIGRTEQLGQPIPASAPAVIRVVAPGDPDPTPTTTTTSTTTTTTSEPDPDIEPRGPGAPDVSSNGDGDLVAAVADDAGPRPRGPLARTGSALGALIYAVPLLVGCGAVLIFGRRRQTT